MQYTEEQITRANQTDLVSFERTGRTVGKSGREYRWKKHDSVTVSGNRWYRHSQSKGGYPVDFVMEFYYANISGSSENVNRGRRRRQAEVLPRPVQRLPITGEKMKIMKRS